MTTQTALITAEQLYEMGDIGRCELRRGEIIHMAPSGADHGSVTMDVTFHVATYVRANRLGRIYAAETGFIITRNPDTVRAPDVAFVANDRSHIHPAKGYFPGAPDLAVEVISFNDRRKDVVSKAKQWLAAGTVSVWVVDPKGRSVDVYRKGGEAITYHQADELKDEPTLPGFVLKLSDIFDCL